MMRKLVFVGILLLAMSGLALAQDFPKFEVFGGYSYLRSDLNSRSMAEYYGNEFGAAGNINGFEGSFTYNLNKWLGIKADFSGHFGSDKVDNTYNYSEQEYDSYSGDYYGTYNEKYVTKGTVQVHQYTMLFGPEFSFRSKGKLRPFAHVLFGFSRVDAHKINVNYNDAYGWVNENQSQEIGKLTGNFSSTGFAMALGGGLDINVNKKLAIRLAQIDYLPTWIEINAKTTDNYDQYSNATYQESYTKTETIKIPSDRYNNIRISAGIVFKF